MELKSRDAKVCTAVMRCTGFEHEEKPSRRKLWPYGSLTDTDGFAVNGKQFISPEEDGAA